MFIIKKYKNGLKPFYCKNVNILGLIILETPLKMFDWISDKKFYQYIIQSKTIYMYIFIYRIISVRASSNAIAENRQMTEIVINAGKPS